MRSTRISADTLGRVHRKQIEKRIRRTIKREFKYGLPGLKRIYFPSGAEIVPQPTLRLVVFAPDQVRCGDADRKSNERITADWSRSHRPAICCVPSGRKRLYACTRRVVRWERLRAALPGTASLVQTRRVHNRLRQACGVLQEAI